MMTSEQADEKIQELLTVVIDSRNGYAEALKDTKHAPMAAFFSSMHELKERHVAELERLLRERGVSADESGSFLSTINRAIISIKSVFGGVDESVIPGLIDGETRILEYYDDAVLASSGRAQEKEALDKKRLELQQMIDTMRAMQTEASSST